MQIPKRNQIDPEKTWDLTRIFASDQKFRQEFVDVEEKLQNFPQDTPEIIASAHKLAKRLDLFANLSRRVDKLTSYATLSSDVDTSNEKYLAMVDNCRRLAATLKIHFYDIKAAFLSLPEEKVAHLFFSPVLKPYHEFLVKLTTPIKNRVPSQVERILNFTSTISSNPKSTYDILINSELEYPLIPTDDGQAEQVNETTYNNLIASSDRHLRQQAYQELYATYGHYQQTFASLLAASINESASFNIMHHYPSDLAASLNRDSIPTSSYYDLLNVVSDHLDLLQRYLKLRQHVLKVDQMHMWDLYVPLVQLPNLSYSLAEAEAESKNALKILGTDYLKHVDYIYHNRVIDSEINQHKVTGSYSDGSYDTDAYELLNWNGSLDSVYTLLHETGHSVHSMYSRENQPYLYSKYSSLIGEIAAETNENLLTEYFLQRIDQPQIRAYILNHYLDSFTSTVFRQTQLAEFEETIHSLNRQGTSLTAEVLNDAYRKINDKYYGSIVKTDNEIAKEWIRIPHLYYNFYVYQYAIAFCAANNIAPELTANSKQKRDHYLQFLKSGSNGATLEILAKANIDLEDPTYLNNAFKLFDQRLQELEKLI